MSRSSLLTGLGVLARLTLAGVLLLAAGLKVGNPAAFAQQIRDYDISPASWAPFLAHAFLAIEIALGVALLVGWRPRLTLPATGVLMVVFMGAVALAWSQGYTGSCGCFGKHGAARGPAGTLIEDTLFLGLAVLGYLTTRHQRGDASWQRVPVALATVVGLLLPGVAPLLPIDGLVTDARAGNRFDDIVVEGYDGDVQQGAYLVALLDPYGEHSAAAVEPLNELSEHLELDVIGVTRGSNDDMVAFQLEHDAWFELGYAPEAAMRRFYRRLPVFLHVEDGRIERAWFDGPPPATALSGS